MKEYEQLLAFTEDVDDVPVALCIVKKGESTDWQESFPEEVLYIPESVFSDLAEAFVEKLGVGYYGTMSLSEQEIVELRQCMEDKSQKTDSKTLQFCIGEINKFLSRSEKLSNTHHLVFDGP